MVGTPLKISGGLEEQKIFSQRESSNLRFFHFDFAKNDNKELGVIDDKSIKVSNSSTQIPYMNLHTNYQQYIVHAILLYAINLHCSHDRPIVKIFYSLCMPAFYD